MQPKWGKWIFASKTCWNKMRRFEQFPIIWSIQMNNILRSAFLCIAVMATGVLHAGDEQDIQALTRGMPKDVVSYISRAAECHHWGGEEAYDKERSEEIEQAAKRLRCDQLDSDEKKFRLKYKKNPTVLARIDRVKAQFE
jgi:hypothetical protein